MARARRLGFWYGVSFPQSGLVERNVFGRNDYGVPAMFPTSIKRYSRRRQQPARCAAKASGRCTDVSYDARMRRCDVSDQEQAQAYREANNRHL